jgi:hypothetical protein
VDFAIVKDFLLGVSVQKQTLVQGKERGRLLRVRRRQLRNKDSGE